MTPPSRQAPDISGRISQESHIELSGLTNNSAKAWLILHMLPKIKEHGTLLWLVRNVREAEELFHQLRFWSDTLKVPVKLTDLQPNNLAALQAMRNTEPGITVAAIPLLHEPFPSPTIFERATRNFVVGQECELVPLLSHLASIGYESDAQASTPGTFARRGGIIDIYAPHWEQPYRIELEGSAISSIRPLNSKTKRLGAEVTNVKVLPIELKNTAMSATIFDYLSRAHTLVVMSDPEGLAELDHDWKTIEERFKSFHQLSFHTFGTRGSVNFDFQSPKLYHGLLDQLGQDLKAWKTEKYDVTFITTKASELKKYCTAKKLPLPNFLTPPPGYRIYGWMSKDEGRVVLTDNDIYGEEKDEAPSSDYSRVSASAFVAELRPGDFVVHMDHGIGRFTGMTTNKIDGIAKEYFVLEYAEGDKLFVPVDAAEKISKYFGLAQPKLHRLSGSNWYQVTHKIREEASKIAQELLRLYAKRDTTAAAAFVQDTAEEKALAESFPYELTPDQARVIKEVSADMEKTTPMDRLVCGDVGFGKTEVAVRAAMRAVMNGKQVAVLSPTTILTQQHFDTFRNRLEHFNVKVELLSRFRSESEQDRVIQKLHTRDVDIIIGTHRLLSDDIKFRDLGLIIIDEEQRFGVAHKEKLKELRTQAHILTLSATPIPRTLNFALSGLRDISVIETPPEGRLPIETLVKPYDDKLVKEAIMRELDRGGQAYYLYNNVETIELAAKRLGRLIPKAKIGIAHGQMAEDVLSKAMSEFDNKKTNILVCSTIIESGLDLPNVNTLIVDNAPKFGLAQLYQLRGRVGRSKRQAYAYFLYHAEKLNDAARKRLQALLEAKELGSGFQIALRDLEIRGTGNLLGREQHGKVAAIGLALYTRLLSQAIEEQKSGVTQKPLREVQIDLPVEIGIPKQLVPSEPKRLKLYQQLAGLTTEKDLDLFMQKEFRGVDLPDPLQNLYEVLRIKIRAQHTDLTHCTASKLSVDGTPRERIILKFASKVSGDTMRLLESIVPGWNFMGDQAKIDKSALGAKWLHTLQRIVEKLRLPDEAPAPVADHSQK
ncbi:MAG: transcription-repair coupling factor [Candidatus Nomurabacteria bacterium]|nr:MAG: transcription-repair coupling factor [Candidatus Nomurabacteria bacterium]